MGLIRCTKEVSRSVVPCGGIFDVTLSLTAEPDIVESPADIVLVLDRSQSLAQESLEHLKNGARKFVEYFADAADGNSIGNGCRIGIVSFATSASQDVPLVTSAKMLKKAIHSLEAGGSTNHEDGFRKASQMLCTSSSRRKIIVMFTDGISTAGCNAASMAQEAKYQGVTMYMMGISGNSGIDEIQLQQWASVPAEDHVFLSDDWENLEHLFCTIAGKIVRAGSVSHICIAEKVRNDFEILDFDQPSKGTAVRNPDGTLQWNIRELGAECRETAVLNFSVRHTGTRCGYLFINDFLNYCDAEGNHPNFGNPQILVQGASPVPDCCLGDVEMDISGCKSCTDYHIGNLCLDSLGRILQLDVTVKNVCPGKRVALAILLKEIDSCGYEHKRGMKTLVIPAHDGCSCKDVTVPCIRFVLPESLDACGCSSICNTRKFKATLLANYIDFDYECCR